VSFTDAQLRAGAYLGVPKSPFTPGYDLVGVVQELGFLPRLREETGRRADGLGRRCGARLRVEENAVEVPADPTRRVVSLVLTYATAYQLLHSEGETARRYSARGRSGVEQAVPSRRAGRGSLVWSIAATAPGSSGSARWRSIIRARIS
jgi:NADPH:quinone reductase-like Zn-dependent oxidoreductase